MARFSSGSKPIANSDLELIELISETITGEVWRAKHTDQPLLPDVVLKLILNPIEIPNFRKKIDSFYAITKKIKLVAGVVEFRAGYIQNDPLAIEFEFADGGNLIETMKVLNAKRKIDSKLIASYMHNIFINVGKAHALEVVHGNLKPSNIFITKSKRLKISGFGFNDIFQKYIENSSTTKLEDTGFLPEFADKALASFYASPQQKNGNKACKQDDIYALGVIWYQLACGDFNIGPVTGSAWKKRLQEKGVTEELLKLIEQCMENSPEDRPGDLLEVAKKIKNFLNPSGKNDLVEATQSEPDIKTEVFPIENPNAIKDVFISYRSACSKDFAHSLYKLFKEKKYRVFFDEHELPNGRWDQHLFENVANAKDFVLIIANKTLESCSNTDDWVLKEILEAQKLKKNIVPILHDDATWDSISCPKNLEWLKLLQGEKWLIAHEGSCFDKLEKKLTAKRFTYSRIAFDLLITTTQFLKSTVVKLVSSSKNNDSQNRTVVTKTKEISSGSNIARFKKPVIITTIASLFLVSIYLLASYIIALFVANFDFDKTNYSVIPEKNYGKIWASFDGINSLNSHGDFNNITGYSDDMIYVSTKKNEIIKIENKKARIVFSAASDESDYFSNIGVVDKDNAVLASFKDDNAVWLHIKPTGVEKVPFSKKFENKGGYYLNKNLLKYHSNNFGFVDKSNVHMFENYTASHKPIVAFDKKEPLDLNKYKLNLNKIYPAKYAQVQFQLENPELSGYDFLWSHFEGNSFYASVFKKYENVKILDHTGKFETIRVEDSNKYNVKFFAFGSSKDNFFLISKEGEIYKRNKDKFEVITESFSKSTFDVLINVWVSNTGKIYGLTEKKIYILEPLSNNPSLASKNK